MGTLHENQRTVVIISPSIILEMRNVSDKNFFEKINTNLLCSVNFFPRKSCRF